MTTHDAEARVARGAALLDEKRPGWWGQVDVETLRMENCSRCVLGQLFGDFYGYLTIGIPPGYAGEFGFSLPNSVNFVNLRLWSMLRDAWVAEIAKRKDAESAPVVTWTHREHAMEPAK